MIEHDPEKRDEYVRFHRDRWNEMYSTIRDVEPIEGKTYVADGWYYVDTILSMPIRDFTMAVALAYVALDLFDASVQCLTMGDPEARDKYGNPILRIIASTHDKPTDRYRAQMLMRPDIAEYFKKHYPNLFIVEKIRERVLN